MEQSHQSQKEDNEGNTPMSNSPQHSQPLRTTRPLEPGCWKVINQEHNVQMYTIISLHRQYRDNIRVRVNDPQFPVQSYSGQRYVNVDIGDGVDADEIWDYTKRTVEEGKVFLDESGLGRGGPYEFRVSVRKNPPVAFRCPPTSTYGGDKDSPVYEDVQNI